MMIRTTTTLSCQFKDNMGNNRSLTLDQPREDITLEEIQEFMEYVIEADVYHPRVEDAEAYLAFINGATLTRKTVETLDLSK